MTELECVSSIAFFLATDNLSFFCLSLLESLIMVTITIVSCSEKDPYGYIITWFYRICLPRIVGLDRLQKLCIIYFCLSLTCYTEGDVLYFCHLKFCCIIVEIDEFFFPTQADWKALRGAIVGCLSLLRRKSHVGVVADDKVKAVVQSYLQNLQVQSLGQHDRKVNPNMNPLLMLKANLVSSVKC